MYVNTKTVKNVLLALVVLVIVTMTACNLAAPAETGSTVEVVLDGTDGARLRGSFAATATWVSIKVVNSSNVQKGFGDLTKTADGVWSGSIHVSESGTMRFIVLAGLDEGKVQVDWIGNMPLVMGSASKLTVGVGVPTANGTEYGPAGGKVFYDKGAYSNGWRYLEAAPSDQISAIRWHNGSYITTGATATGIGSGSANTATIVTQQGTGSYAASLCANLVLGGYDDWFLPSKDELHAISGKRASIGGFPGGYPWYWSSSEYDNQNADRECIYDGGTSQGYNLKFYELYGVRAVRAF